MIQSSRWANANAWVNLTVKKAQCSIFLPCWTTTIFRPFESKWQLTSVCTHEDSRLAPAMNVQHVTTYFRKISSRCALLTSNVYLSIIPWARERFTEPLITCRMSSSKIKTSHWVLFSIRSTRLIVLPDQQRSNIWRRKIKRKKR